MTNRCIAGGKHQQRFKSYENTTHSELFSNFDTWYEWALTKEGFMCVDDKGFLYELDKDLLGDGTKYSEDSCCFLPRYLNNYLKVMDRLPDFKRDKAFFQSTYENEFSTLDENALEKLFEITSFKYGLDKEGRFTDEEYEKHLANRKEKQRVDVEISKILYVKDDTDIMMGIVFSNGYYKIQTHIIPEGLDFKNSFDDVLDCVICKFNFRISKISKVFDGLSGNKEFLKHRKYSDCIEKISSVKGTLQKIIDGEIKLKKWVLVDY